MDTNDFFPSDEILKRYILLIHEIGIRIDLVAAACNGQLNMTPPYAREYCYLQYRRICELIALGGVILHRDLKSLRAKKVKNEWNAHTIMKILHKNHPHAFPQPVTVTNDGEVFEIRGNEKINALDFAGFNKLYAECGKVLHRGTISSLEESGRIGKEDYDKVIGWSQKIVNLLNEHVVAFPSGDGLFLIGMRSTNGWPVLSVFRLNKKTEKLEVVQRFVEGSLV